MDDGSLEMAEQITMEPSSEGSIVPDIRIETCEQSKLLDVRNNSRRNFLKEIVDVDAARKISEKCTFN
jgi:hypothetical protein